MSRPAASKSRLEKTRGGTQATTPAIAHDIIPGKFTDQDWNYVIDADDSEDFVAGLVEEVAEDALSIIYDKYIERQLIPFTVALAKDAVLQIVEWYFLEHEQQEEDLSNPSFIEDEEPPPVLVDAWAQGVMQRRPIRSVMTARDGLEKIEEDLKVDQVSEESDAVREATEFSEAALTAETTQVTAESLLGATGSTQAPRQKVPVVIPYSTKRKVAFRPYNGRMRSAGVSKIEETLYETEMRLRLAEEQKERVTTTQEVEEELLRGMPASCHSILKGRHPQLSPEEYQVQMGRPPGNKEVVYDAMGNVTSVVRIDADRLPLHTVNVDFKIVDPEVEASNARLDAIRRGLKVTPPKKRTETRTKAASGEKVQLLLDKLGDKPSLGGGQGGRDPVHPLPPSLVDSIILAPGVVVKEHDQTRRGPRQPRSRELLPEASLKSLRPVKPPIGAVNREQLASQLIDPRAIAVKPMPKLAPIPSIPSQ